MRTKYYFAMESDLFWKLLDNIGPLEKILLKEDTSAEQKIEEVQKKFSDAESKLSRLEIMGLNGYINKVILDYFSKHNKAKYISTAQGMVQKFQPTKDELKSNNHVAFRTQFRRSHGILANYFLEENDLPKALELINKCFDIKSGSGDYGDVFEAFHVTRAKIFLSAMRAGLVTKEEAFEAISLYKRRRAAAPYAVAADAELDAIASSSEFESQGASPLEKLKTGPKDESALKAIKRYENALESLEIDEDESALWEVEILDKESQKDIEALEKKLQTSIPKSLKEFYSNHGAVNIKDFDLWNSLQVCTLSKVAGLVDQIDAFWGGRPEFKKYMKAAELEALNTQFFVFGQYHHDDNYNTHFFFDKTGNFGTITYNQDEWDDFQDRLNDLLSGKTAVNLTFDELISAQVNDLVQSLIEYKDEKDAEFQD